MKLTGNFPEMMEPLTSIPTQSSRGCHYDGLVNTMRAKLTDKLGEVYGSAYDWRSISLGWQQALIRLGFVPSLNRWNNPIEPADKVAACDRLISRLQESHQLEYADNYGEPGYTDPDRGILFCNWNDVPQPVQDFLESQGYELEWQDEWYIHYEQGATAYRTSPDSHGWTCQVKYCDGYVLTPKDDISEWIDECKSEDKADLHSHLPDWVNSSDLEEHGYFVEDEELEVSMHYASNETPTSIVSKLQKRFKSNFESVLFQVNYAEQFATGYRVYVRLNDWEDSE